MIAVKRELRTGIAVLLAIQIALAFAAIGLLSRMTPVIDRILSENGFSIEAGEDMLVVLARSRNEAPGQGDLEGRFFDAMRRARDNVTEPEEPAILDAIEEGYRRFSGGDVTALGPTLGAVSEFIGSNRLAMRRTRDGASRLSEAGAWAAVLAAIVGFAVGVVVAIRIQRRVVEPLDEIFAVLKASSGGDAYRRCQFRDAPAEVREMMSILNELLDHRFGADPVADSK